MSFFRQFRARFRSLDRQVAARVNAHYCQFSLCTCNFVSSFYSVVGVSDVVRFKVTFFRISVEGCFGRSIVSCELFSCVAIVDAVCDRVMCVIGTILFYRFAGDYFPFQGRSFHGFYVRPFARFVRAFSYSFHQVFSYNVDVFRVP